MATRDYYEVLGVPRNASQDDIKKAYRRLAMELHPDRNPDRADAEEHFKELSAAYAVLGNPEKRARYDAGGGEDFGGGVAFDPSMFEEIFGSFGFGGGLEDLFSSLFGGGGGARTRNGPRRGADLRYSLEIGFEEAAFGTEAKIRIPRTESCSGCSGSGAAPGGIATCEACRGSGQSVYRHGFLQVARTCGACGGAGRVIRERCKTCNGEGRTRSERTVTVKVPPGVDTGIRLRVPGEGDGGARGGPYGDLFVDITVRPHSLFVREDADVHSELEVGLADLVLGGTFEVETLHGQQTVELPPGTLPGTTVTLKSQGVAKLGRNSRGHHILHIVARIPKKLTDREREIWEELRLADRTRSKEKSGERNLFDRVKDFLGGD